MKETRNDHQNHITAGGVVDTLRIMVEGNHFTFSLSGHRQKLIVARHAGTIGDEPILEDQEQGVLDMTVGSRKNGLVIPDAGRLYVARLARWANVHDLEWSLGKNRLHLGASELSAIEPFVNPPKAQTTLVTSPAVGLFSIMNERNEPYVVLGEEVNPHTIVGVVHLLAARMDVTVESGVEGIVQDIFEGRYASTPVEYGQRLMAIKETPQS